MTNPPLPSSSRYYVTQGEQKVGPLDEPSLLAKIRTGEFTAETLGWREGAPAWEPLGSMLPAAFAPTSVNQAPPVLAAPPEVRSLDTNVLGARFLALLIDGVVLAILNAIVFPAEAVLPLIINVLVTAAYSIIFLGSAMQATLGMYMMGLKLVRQNGGVPGYGTATIRSFGAAISAFFFAIGYFFAFFTPKTQTLHDMMAGTYVVKA